MTFNGLFARFVQLAEKSFKDCYMRTDKDIMKILAHKIFRLNF